MMHAQFAALMRIDKNALALVGREMRTMRFKAGQHVFHAGDSCNNFLIVARGSVRVSIVAETGREIVLYRVEDGQTCVLTSICLFSGSTYDAEGVAEVDTEAYVLPKSVFLNLLSSSEQFREFVFSSYGEKMHALIGLVQEVVHRHVDRRLARLLLARLVAGQVELTHQAIAVELNTAREVVTRLLHEFECRGWVRLARGRIEVDEASGLSELAQGL